MFNRYAAPVFLLTVMVVFVALASVGFASIPRPLVGEVWKHGGGFDGTTLTLGADGRYEAHSYSCIPLLSYSSGTWRKVENEIILSPSKEEGFIAGKLSRLVMRQWEGQLWLTDTHPPSTKESMNDPSSPAKFAFRRVEQSTP